MKKQLFILCSRLKYKYFLKIVATSILFVFLFSITGCGKFSPTFFFTTGSRDKAIQKTVKEWGEAFKDKDRNKYLQVVDEENESYYKDQAELFDNLSEVSFSKVIMGADTNSGLGWNLTDLNNDFIVKVMFNYILEGGSPNSFGPIERYINFKYKDGKWKAERDVTDSIQEGAPVKDLFGFGKLKQISTNHFVILFSPGEEILATEIAAQADRSFEQIAVDFDSAPKYKTPIKINDDYEDIVDVFGETDEGTPWALAMTSGVWSDSEQYEIIINQEKYLQT